MTPDGAAGAEATAVHVRVRIPGHLQELAGIPSEVRLPVEGAVTLTTVLDQVETRWPVLRGTLRDPATKERRAYMRYFACGRDLSLEDRDAPLPEEVVRGEEPLRLVGAIAGG